VLESLFDFYFVRPERLAARLIEAGKQPLNQDLRAEVTSGLGRTLPDSCPDLRVVGARRDGRAERSLVAYGHFVAPLADRPHVLGLYGLVALPARCLEAGGTSGINGPGPHPPTASTRNQKHYSERCHPSHPHAVPPVGPVGGARAQAPSLYLLTCTGRAFDIDAGSASSRVQYRTPSASDVRTTARISPSSRPPASVDAIHSGWPNGESRRRSTIQGASGPVHGGLTVMGTATWLLASLDSSTALTSSTMNSR
jgi:hypothetical protein